MRRRSFIVFGDDWGGHPSSVQHIFRRVARDHRTVWVNTVGLRPPRLDKRDAARVVRKVRGWLSPASKPAAATGGAMPGDEALDLHVVSPPMLPWMRPPALRRINRESMRAAVHRACDRLGIHAPIVVTTVPNGVDAAGVAGSQALVYYCVDDFTNWPGVDAVAARAMESELLDVCCGVLATSQNLADTRRPRDGVVTLLPHGVDVEHLGRASDPGTAPVDGARRGRPVLGYLGLVDARLDVDLVLSVARARRDWDVVLLGPTDAAPDPRLSAEPNLRLVPGVPYARLPEALAAFDVAILPYVRNDLTRSINPLKLREYLASGKPIVATSLPEVARFAPEVSIADTRDDFVSAVESALEGPRDRRSQRAALLAADSWDARAERFLAFIEEAAAGRVAPLREPTDTP